MKWSFEPLRLRLLGLVLLLSCGIGCPCVRGAVNASPELRWWLFSNFGAGQVCPEMLKRGAPLRWGPNGNVVGRFFPSTCRHDVNDSAQTVTIHFGGTGFTWTPVAGRVGFSVEASVEYGMDFWMGEDAIYVWAKTRRVVYGPEFRIGSVENKIIDSTTKSPLGFLTNEMGSQIVQGQIASGFTVVHADQGDEFTLGILQPPARPKKPFDTSEGDRFVFANETTEIHNGQIDVLGPFEIPDTDQSLFLRMRLSGNPVDALVLPRAVCDPWREAIQQGAPLGPPPAAPIFAFVVQPGSSETRQKVRVPQGQYYVVIDNSSRIGSVSPPWNPLSPLGAGTVVMSYTAEAGEADDDF